MIHYLLAKYVDDLTRHEPTNVGVVVYDGERVVARFDGEDENEKIDLRRVRNRVTGSHAYRGWVDYWRAALRDPKILSSDIAGYSPGDPAVIEQLLALPSRDFYLERGGTILMDTEDRSLAKTLDDLFARLVRQPDPPAPPSLREKSKDALAIAGVPLDDEARFKEQHTVSLNVEGMTVEEEVSYAVMNGQWHYLQEMPFDPVAPRRSRKEASHCAFLFEHAGWDREQGLILYDEADISTGSYRLLELLMKFADTVNVNEPEHAAERIHTQLGL